MTMKTMKKFLSLLLCIALLFPLFPQRVVAEGSKQDESASQLEMPAGRTSANAPASQSATTHQVSSAQEFHTALSKAVDGDIININGSVLLQENSQNSLIINKSVTITGGALTVRYSGILLGADVTFKNITLCFPSRSRNAIMANGYSLTMENVVRDSSGQQIHLFCGGVTGSSTPDVPSGSHGQITIKGSTSLSNIYAGSISADGKDNVFSGNATIRIDSSATGKMGTIYACGAMETPAGDNFFDFTNIDPPAPSESKFPVNGTVDIQLYNNVVVNVDGATGGSGKTNVAFTGGQYPSIDVITLKNLSGLSVLKGSLTPKAGSSFSGTSAEVSVPAGTTLGIANFGSAPSIGNFSGNGNLILGDSQTLTINGNVAGSTTVAIGRLFNGASDPVTEGYTYIRAQNSTQDSFTLATPSTQPNMGLLLSNGDWIAGDITNLKVTGSYTIDENDKTKFIYTIAPINGAEYRMDNGQWQSEPVFKGIEPLSAHTFYARIRNMGATGSDATGNTGEVVFHKLDNPDTPSLDVSVTGSSSNRTVTIKQVKDAEYRFDSGAWSEANQKSGFTDTVVSVQIRYKATDTMNASQAVSRDVNTAKQAQKAPPTFKLAFKLNSDGKTYTATIPTVANGLYSFDGATYSSRNTKTDCAPNKAYTGYVKYAETDTYGESAATSNTQTTPKLTVKTPVISPNGGNFTGSQNVTIACSTNGATIYYTLDGSDPLDRANKGRSVYSKAFTINKSTTVRAIAEKNGMNHSAEIKYTFVKSGNAGDNSNNSGSSGGNSGNSSNQGNNSGNSGNSSNQGNNSGNFDDSSSSGNNSGNSAGSYGPVSGTWIYGSGGWWFQYHDGTYPVNSIQNIDGVYYAFDAIGYMITGWYHNGFHWYYFNGSGAMCTGWILLDGTWYYLDESGAWLW